IAPGGAHLSAARQGSRVTLKVADGPHVSGHKPSIDVMFRSVVAAYGNACLGIIMTGMGHDGVEGCRQIRDAGGYVLGQDQQTSADYWMHKDSFTAGHDDEQFPLDELPNLIRRRCQLLDRTGSFGPTNQPHADCRHVIPSP